MTEFKIETKPDDKVYLMQHWAAVDEFESGFKAEMACGAGFGNTVVELMYEEGDTRITETFSMADVFKAWIKAKREEVAIHEQV